MSDLDITQMCVLAMLKKVNYISDISVKTAAENSFSLLRCDYDDSFNPYKETSEHFAEFKKYYTNQSNKNELT